MVSPLRYRVPCIIREHVLIFTCLFFSFKVINNDKFSIIGYITLLKIKNTLKFILLPADHIFSLKVSFPVFSVSLSLLLLIQRDLKE